MDIVVLFAEGRTASFPVAAIPAVARALREVALAGVSECCVSTGDDWQPSVDEMFEIQRIAAPLVVHFRPDVPDRAAVLITGEALVPAEAIRSAIDTGLGSNADNPGIAFTIGAAAGAAARLSAAEGFALLRRQARAVINATGKRRDGIISRHINRPISRSITLLLLQRGPIDPNRATFGTATLAIAMLGCLVLLPGQPGLLWGALLFQAASIFDGVDGEIARATFRTSSRGASLDSLVDAITNFLFFGGVVFNLHQQGETGVAVAALVGLVGLMFGTMMLGFRSRGRQGVVDFEAVKQQVSEQKSPVWTWLIWLTMRDFYAFAAALLVALGLAVPAVLAFVTVVAGWLAVVTVMLVRRR